MSSKINLYEVVYQLKKKNPYPPDIFIPLTSKDKKDYVKLLVDNGFSSDRIHADFGRLVWNNCVDELMKILEEQNEQ